MTTGQVERLDELAAVTREYARYSRSSFGLALTVAGCWLAVAGAAIAVSCDIGAHLLRSSPLVWLLAVRRRRQNYQRLGEVVEQEVVEFPFVSPGEARVALLVLTCVSCVLGIVTAAGSGTGALAVDAAIFVAVAAVAPGTVKGAADALATSAFAMFGTAMFLHAWGPAVRGGFHVALGVAFAAAGVWQHLRYRALERRLAALRSPAP